MVKKLPAIQEIQVQSLSREDPLEKGMATPCTVLAWSVPWTEEPGGLQSMGLQRTVCSVLLELAQTHVHRVGDAIQPSHPLSSPYPPVFNLSQHQGLSQ